MEKSHNFQLGDKAEDLVSGIVGILNARTVDVNGMEQFSIQPNVSDKGEAIYVDRAQLKLIEAQIVPLTPVPSDIPDYMGHQVEHIVSKFKGIVTEKVEYLNGCVRYCVQGEVSKDNPKGAYMYVPYQQLKPLRNSRAIKTESKPAENGGPSRRACDVM